MSSRSRAAAGIVRTALAEVAKALGHEHRVELIEQLAQGPRNVEALAERVGLSLANASQHLQQLRRAGLVSTQRDGKRVVYRLADEVEIDIVLLLGALRHVAEHAMAAMERIVATYFRARDELEPVAAEELRAATRGRCRDPRCAPGRRIPPWPLAGCPEYPAAPVGTATFRITRKHEIVAYCRGPYCVLSFEAVAALRAHGFNVRRFEHGFPEWKAAGLPIEAAA